jgi:membrane-bound lytic murein transglycosylase B
MVHTAVRWAIAGLAFGLVVGACETTRVGGGPGVAAKPPSGPQASAGGASGFRFATSGNEQFDQWRTAFAARARVAGRREASIIAVLDGLQPMEQEVQTQAFDNQAEFVKPIWDYSRTAVSLTRISNGQTLILAHDATFDAIEAAYAPPREIVASIWAMESNYGQIIGNIDTAQALATQASIGRRKDFNEAELIAMMQIIEEGTATRDMFRRGSWAGAFGQTQFMPSTFLQYARDFDGDGRKDLWFNSGDALASAANYLTGYGWRQGEPWAVETKIPGEFDYSLGDGRKMTVAGWKKMGLVPATAPQFAADENLLAELFLPAGSYGPAFLLFDNFFVIKKYNNSDSYALAVGLLADRLASRPDLSRQWPTSITMLTTEEVKQMQEALNKLGHGAGAPDGLIGRGTRAALQRFQKSKGLAADGFPTTDMLAKVLAAAA